MAWRSRSSIGSEHWVTVTFPRPAATVGKEDAQQVGRESSRRPESKPGPELESKGPGHESTRQRPESTGRGWSRWIAAFWLYCQRILSRWPRSPMVGDTSPYPPASIESSAVSCRTDVSHTRCRTNRTEGFKNIESRRLDNRRSRERASGPHGVHRGHPRPAGHGRLPGPLGEAIVP